MIANRRTLLILIAINGLVYLFWVRVFPQAGLDFQAFYYAGETIKRPPAQLYDSDYQRLSQRAQFGEHSEFELFFHPPHEIPVFVPFSMLPYRASLNAWRVFSLLCLVGSGLLLGHTIGTDPITIALLSLAMSQVGVCIYLGQDSMLLLLLLCGCFWLLRQERDVTAALLLSLALFKPQIPMVLAIAVLATGRKKFFAWFMGAGGILGAASIVFLGREGFRQMLRSEHLAEHSIAKMPDVRGLIAFIVGDHRFLALALLAIALVTMFTVWRRSRSLEFAVANSICLGCAFTPYIWPYDLVLLAIPLALIAQKPRKYDGAIGALLTSTMLLLILILLKAQSLLVIPTLALGFMTFRLLFPVASRVPALEAEPQLS